MGAGKRNSTNGECYHRFVISVITFSWSQFVCPCTQLSVFVNDRLWERHCHSVTPSQVNMCFFSSNRVRHRLSGGSDRINVRDGILLNELSVISFQYFTLMDYIVTENKFYEMKQSTAVSIQLKSFYLQMSPCFPLLRKNTVQYIFIVPLKLNFFHMLLREKPLLCYTFKLCIWAHFDFHKTEGTFSKIWHAKMNSWGTKWICKCRSHCSVCMKKLVFSVLGQFS